MFHEYLLGYSRSLRYSKSHRDIAISLWLEYFIPHLKGRLDEQYEQFLYKEKTIKNTIERVFVRIYPAISCGYEASKMAFILLFLIKKTLYCTPWLFLQNSYLLQNTIDSPAKGIRLVDKVLSYVKYAVPIGLLVLHNYDVWSEKMPTALFGSFNTLLPAPPVIEQVDGGIQLPEQSDICPLCRKLIADECCLKTGYRFCYSCISKYLDEYKKCPLTNTACNRSHIIKIYRE